MDDICDVYEAFINPGGHNHVYCSALQFSSKWRRLLSLMQRKEIANDVKLEEV